ncbi:diacylglycerol kinase family protein [Streptomyces sp. NPDC006670]|uniref:diacylglycerol kinase family protein n=1 Tax=Streptomyces sp. NPDC006670 TaxID=3154476 RepID=UPI0033F659FF
MRPGHPEVPAPGRLRLLWLLPVQAALMVGVGLLVTGPLADQWPLAAEDAVDRGLAAHRGGPALPLSQWLSLLAGTPSIIALTVLAVAALLALSRGRWLREALFLAGAVAAQSAVFLLVTLLVERPRPHVAQLDAAPPTSSFPSGHVGAAVALFGGLAVLAVLRHRPGRPWLRHALAAVLLVIPVLVACSRLYRGMHHPSDVVGGLLNGACTLLVLAHAVLLPVRTRTPSHTAGATATAAPTADRYRSRPGPGPGRRPAVVVRHPHCTPQLAEHVGDALRRHGYADQVWTKTSAEHPAGALARRIDEEDPALVVACGGDGTVRACADLLAHTGIPLAVVPCGTGNLLAHNLRLPTDPYAALEAALSGETAHIDVGRVLGDGPRAARFTVMAGAGFDAAMVAGASERVKRRLGWAAYAVSAARHLGDPRMRLSIRLDGGPARERRARMVVIGNVGTLQGGLPLLPDARPDSGRLEVVLLDPRGIRGWLGAAGHLLARVLPGGPVPGPGGSQGPVAGGALEYFSAVRVDIRFTRPQPRELDGDVMAAGTRLTAEVEPGALLIRVPPRTPYAPGERTVRPRTAPAGEPARRIPDFDRG